MNIYPSFVFQSCTVKSDESFRGEPSHSKLGTQTHSYMKLTVGQSQYFYNISTHSTSQIYTLGRNVVILLDCGKWYSFFKILSSMHVYVTALHTRITLNPVCTEIS